jgi:hypothetical protein
MCTLTGIWARLGYGAAWVDWPSVHVHTSTLWQAHRTLAELTATVARASWAAGTGTTWSTSITFRADESAYDFADIQNEDSNLWNGWVWLDDPVAACLLPQGGTNPVWWLDTCSGSTGAFCTVEPYSPYFGPAMVAATGLTWFGQEPADLWWWRYDLSYQQAWNATLTGVTDWAVIEALFVDNDSVGGSARTTRQARLALDVPSWMASGVTWRAEVWARTNLTAGGPPAWTPTGDWWRVWAPSGTWAVGGATSAYVAGPGVDLGEAYQYTNDLCTYDQSIVTNAAGEPTSRGAAWYLDTRSPPPGTEWRGGRIERGAGVVYWGFTRCRKED